MCACVYVCHPVILEARHRSWGQPLGNTLFRGLDIWPHDLYLWSWSAAMMCPPIFCWPRPLNSAWTSFVVWALAFPSTTTSVKAYYRYWFSFMADSLDPTYGSAMVLHVTNRNIGVQNLTELHGHWFSVSSQPHPEHGYSIAWGWLDRQ